MTIRGPKPKPAPLRLVKTQGEEEAQAPERIKVTANVPTAPEWLLPEAKAEWKRLGQRLADQGLLSDFDRAAFAAYCQAWGTVASLEKEQAKLRKKSGDALAGIATKTAGGNLVHHPLATTIAKARAEMVKIAAEFGLTPSARARLDTDAAKNRGGGAKGKGGKADPGRFFD